MDLEILLHHGVNITRQGLQLKGGDEKSNYNKPSEQKNIWPYLAVHNQGDQNVFLVTLHHDWAESKCRQNQNLVE